MEACSMVYAKLDELNIPYDVVEHPAVYTTDEADVYIEVREGVRTKSLFLTNKKKTAFYLLVMDEAKRLDMDAFKALAGESRMRFAPEESMLEKLGLTPGSVSLFGLLNDAQHEVKVYLDKEMLSEKVITFHPNDNTKTLFLSMEDMFVFLKAMGYEANIVEL